METNTSTHKKKPNILKWTIAIAIVIVVNLFFHYVIATFYKEPTFEKFCPMQNVVLNDAVACVNYGGQWTNNQLSPQQVTEAVKGGQALGWCSRGCTGAARS
jgi:hypothetical protein